MRKKEKVRLNLELTPLVKERLERLVVKSEADSMSEAIRRALAIYEIIIERHLEKEMIICRSEDGTELELVIY